ncbi:MAG: aldose 1-epimerase family protein [Clostridiales bacterium]|nr:aldose 1-epimerase family protein [Clostridiales bacterium]
MAMKDFSKREILKYVGDYNQILGIRDCTLNGGRAQGVRAMEIKNGSGLEFTVLPDRSMDISQLSYKGINLSYLSKSGIVAPQYYNETGIEFLRSFYAGFLTTCGLRNVGSPVEDDGEAFGLHGRISNTPGENVSSGVEWVDDKPVIRVSGRMREARLFGENLVMNRTIICSGGENKFEIIDTIENDGFRREPLMILYHFNLGYPLLDENAQFVIPAVKTRPKDEVAEKGLDAYHETQIPTPGFNEQVFYHTLAADDNGDTSAALINEKLGLGLVIGFNKNSLFNLTQWKQMGAGDYVMGVEPGNCYVEGRVDAREKGVLEYLEPGETKEIKVTAEILDGSTEIDNYKDKISKLLGR